MTSRNSFPTYRQQYPDPFLDIASTKLPKSQKKLLEMFYLFSTTHAQISPIVKKIAKYPITNLIVNANEVGQESLEKKWKTMLEDDLNIFEVLEGGGLDYVGYGNVFLTIHRPFVRSYQCNSCQVDQPAGRLKYYIRGKKFLADCPACKKRSSFKGKDNATRVVSEIEVVRIPPQDMHIRYNPLTGKSEYYRVLPNELKKAVNSNKPDRFFIDTTPWVYIQAALNKKKIKFDRNRIIHLKEPGLSGRTQHWGMPIIMASLKDAYLNQVYKKADETVANERTVPARFVYPQSTSNDPFRTISLGKWSRYIGKSIRRYRHDKNAIMPVPFPVGVAEIGGDAQRLFTSSVREMTIKEIIGSTGVPEGFLGDGMTWSGGSVQLRMLENMLMSYMRSLNKILNFTVREVAKITEIPPVKVKLKPFRMADDIQMLQILMSLASQKHVSFKEILDRMDLDWNEQHEIIRNETDKVQEIMVQEALTEAKAGLASVNWSVQSQARTQSAEQMLEALNSDMELERGHLSREVEYEQGEQNNQEQQESEQQDQQQQSELEQRGQEAQISRTEAEAEQKDTKTDIAQESYQMTPVVEAFVKRFLTMDPRKRDQQLEKLEENAPTVAAKVRERMSEMEGQEGQNKAGTSILSDLRQNAKNPAELAERILMLPPEVRQQAFEELQASDPTLAVAVAQHLNSSRRKASGRSSSGPSIQPNPEQRPPRRK